jgi:hypothetical protein
MQRARKRNVFFPKDTPKSSFPNNLSSVLENTGIATGYNKKHA